MPRRRSTTSCHGYTLVELTSVMVVMGITLAAATPAFVSYSRSLSLNQGRETLVQDLRRARQTAVTAHHPVIVAFTVSDGSSSYSVHADRNGDLPPPALSRDQSLLITAGSDIVLQRDVTYEDYAGGNSVLGLFSNGGSVRVGTGAPNDMRLDAFVMAAGANASFTVDNYASWTPRGTFHLRGGMVSSRYGAFGTFSSSGVQRTGYGRDFQYDRRGFVPPSGGILQLRHRDDTFVRRRAYPRPPGPRGGQWEQVQGGQPARDFAKEAVPASQGSVETE